MKSAFGWSASPATICLHKKIAATGKQHVCWSMCVDALWSEGQTKQKEKTMHLRTFSFVCVSPGLLRLTHWSGTKKLWYDPLDFLKIETKHVLFVLVLSPRLLATKADEPNVESWHGRRHHPQHGKQGEKRRCCDDWAHWCRPMENEAAPETKCDAEKIVQLAACSALKYWHGMYRSSAPICGRFFARSSQLPVLLLCCKQQMPRDFCAQQKSWGGDGWFNKNSKHKGRLGVALKTQKSRGSLFTPPFFIGNVTENFALASGSHAMHWRPVCLHNSELLFRGRFGTRENWKI